MIKVIAPYLIVVRDFLFTLIEFFMLIKQNGRSVIWNGPSHFPFNFTEAKNRILMHRKMIKKFKNSIRRSWHQQRICEISTIYPALA